MFPNYQNPTATEGLNPAPPAEPDMPQSAPPAGPSAPAAASLMGLPSAPAQNPMDDLVSAIMKQVAGANDRIAQHEQTLKGQLTTDALGKYLPKPSATQMLSDALANFGMARLTGGNFTPIQVRRYDEAFKRHEADTQNVRSLLDADRLESTTAQSQLNHMLGIQRLVEKQQNDEARIGLGHENNTLRETLAKMRTNAVAGTIPGAALKALMEKDTLGNPIDENGAYHGIRDYANKLIAAYPAPAGGAQKPVSDWYGDPNSSTGYTHAYMDPATGKVRFAVQNVEPPSYLKPTISQTMRFVPQPDNTWKAVPVETVRSKGGSKNAPGIKVSAAATAGAPPAAPTATPVPAASSAPAPQTPQPHARSTPAPPPVAPKSLDTKMAVGMLYDDQGNLRLPSAYSGSGPVRAGQTVGGRGLAPGQRMAAEGSAKAMDVTADRMATVLKYSPRIAGLIDSGKIWLAARPDGLAMASRVYDLSPEDEKLAAAFVNLTEDVNIFRKPFNATGFRGPEAFAALQSQKGNLLARPNVMREVIINGVRALQGQRAAIDRALAAGGRPVPNDQVASNYVILAGGDPAKAKQMAAADGYKVD